MENNQNKYHIESNQIVVANGINHGNYNDIANENNIVETHGRASLRMTDQSVQQKFYRKPNSISSFIADLKSVINSKMTEQSQSIERSDERSDKRIARKNQYPNQSNRKYKNKYRIESHRKPGWDYSNNGFYFITIVTQNRECNLGKIVNEKIILSNFGKIVCNEWLKSFEMRTELILDEYIIMPNHIHAIIVLDKNKITINTRNVGDGDCIANENDIVVETHGRASGRASGRTSGRASGRASLRMTDQSVQQKFYRKPKSISSFIAGLKSVINSKIDDYIDCNHLNIPKYNKNNHFFQPNYHDHIIRDNSEYQKISEYIINNPKNWNKDRFYEPNNRKNL